MDLLTITQQHALPGRLRMHLSYPPVNEKRFIEAMCSHKGYGKISFNPLSQSLLIHYDTTHLTREEVLLRAALALSVEHQDRAVYVFAKPESEVMTDGAILAGIFLLAVSGIRWLGAIDKNSMMETVVGGGVAAAVIEHGWREAKEKGVVHPELLSLGYLLTSLIKGAPLKGAAITWAASFGRHLFLEEGRCIEVKPVKKEGEKYPSEQYLLRLVPGATQSSPFLSIFRGILRTIGIAEAHGSGESLFGELRNVAKAHGEVVEGLKAHPGGIPLTFR